MTQDAPQAVTPSGLDEAPRSTPDVLDRLQDLIESVGSATDLTCTIWRLIDSTQKWSMISQGKTLLDVDQVGRKFGSGEFRMRVTWRTQGVRVGKPFTREIEFVIGPEYDEIARRSGARVGLTEAPPADLEKVLGLAERIASIRAPQADSGAALAGIMDRILDRLDRMQERQDTKFEKLLEVVASNRQEVVDPMDSMRKLVTFGKEMGLPIVQGIGEATREPWLEIAEMVAGNVGKFLEMLAEAQKSKLAQVRLMANPAARKLATVGKREFENPESRAKMVAHLDEKIGKEQTDKILSGLGVARA